MLIYCTKILVHVYKRLGDYTLLLKNVWFLKLSIVNFSFTNLAQIKNTRDRVGCTRFEVEHISCNLLLYIGKHSKNWRIFWTFYSPKNSSLYSDYVFPVYNSKLHDICYFKYRVLNIVKLPLYYTSGFATTKL